MQYVTDSHLDLILSYRRCLFWELKKTALIVCRVRFICKSNKHSTFYAEYVLMIVQHGNKLEPQTGNIAIVHPKHLTVQQSFKNYENFYLINKCRISDIIMLHD